MPRLNFSLKMLIVKFKNIQFARAIVGTNMTGLLYSEALYNCTSTWIMPSHHSNRQCIRWRNTWPSTSNHIDNKNDWKPKENKPEDRKKGKEKRWTKSLLHETTFSIVSCVYDLVCLHLVWYGLKLCLFKLNVLG